MIHSLGLRNFKGIRRADVDLERLTVIVGPNASGKTSFLEGLHRLSLLGSARTQALFQDSRDPALLYRRGANGVEMELSCSGTDGDIRIRVVPPATSAEAWRLLVGDHEVVFIDLPLDDLAIDDSVRGFSDALDKIRPGELLRLNPALMTDPALDNGTRMRADGAGLPAALAFLALNQPDDFQEIQEQLRAVVPIVKRIRFNQVVTNRSTSGPPISKFSILFDFVGGRDIPADLASEGTILVLGLLTALMGKGRPDIILLDDLDRGLHPKAQREVVSLLRIILDQNPELQIVATTHSPYLVDNLRPEEVRLTTLGEDGTVSIAGLVDHPDFDKWKDEMAPGEMWSLFGEQWVSEVKKKEAVGD